VFFTVSQAFGPDSNGNLPLIYARAAYGISEKNTDAVILAGELLSADEQYELAAETYGAVPAADDQFVEAQMGRAEALERLGALDDALAVLGDLPRRSPTLRLFMPRWATRCAARRCAKTPSTATPQRSTVVDTASSATGSCTTPARSAIT
jgi:thioredoxin-like negative regulator of GroEL